MDKSISAIGNAKDPVCGMDVVPGIARSWDYLFDEMVYHFCGSECRSRFQADPKGILQSGPGHSQDLSASPQTGEGAVWGSNLRALFKKWRTRV